MPGTERVNWVRTIPFIAMHLAPLLAIFTGVTLFDLLLCAALYVVRMFFITAGYHRYFAHHSYKLGRFAQFVMAFGGTTATQKGVLWWAGYHRHHHLYSDTANDWHSPIRGFWWSHMGWFFRDSNFQTRPDLIEDFYKFPELRFLDKYYLLPPTLLAVATLLIGGWSALLIGFFLSTVLLSHGTFFINSLAHVFGRRRYVTGDTSRNSLILALITLGEGWHNNHHYYRSASRQGFFWWEIDISYYVLKLLSWIGIVKDLRQPPKEVLYKNRVTDGAFDFGVLQAKRERAAFLLSRLRQRAGRASARRCARLEAFLDSTKHLVEGVTGSHKQLV